MPPRYLYDVWDGKKVIGTFDSGTSRLYGAFVVIPVVSELKRNYSGKHENIKVPLVTRCVYDDGIEYRMRITLDVRKKSKRQIKIILSHNLFKADRL